MTGAEIMAVVGFFVMLFGFVFGLWKYIESRINTARGEVSMKADGAAALASLARQELSDHKLHVAETYISKAGHRESTDQVMEAISAVKTAIDGTNLRIDRMWESHAKPSPRRTG
ncbi:hypothetical protein QBK99_12645 [Corticibacterium sp. UT-5YL-CI-8]|nr:hypothetical protein [Tianweitania sp. UT-5YL-CI-8]